MSLLEDRVVNGVDEPDAQRLVRIDRAPREHELLCDSDPADAREPLGASPAGDDPEVHLRLTELRTRRRVADVARQRELAAAAEREAVHGCDRGLCHRLEEPARLVAERAPRLRLLDAETAHVLDVGSG